MRTEDEIRADLATGANFAPAQTHPSIYRLLHDVAPLLAEVTEEHDRNRRMGEALDAALAEVADLRRRLDEAERENDRLQKGLMAAAEIRLSDHAAVQGVEREREEARAGLAVERAKVKAVEKAMQVSNVGGYVRVEALHEAVTTGRLSQHIGVGDELVAAAPAPAQEAGRR